MSFADELRKKSDQAPKDERDEEKLYLNEIYFSLKEGVLRCFLRKCYEEASRGETKLVMYVDFLHIIGIIHEQERVFVNQTDYPYVEQILRTNKSDLTDFLTEGLRKKGFSNIKVRVTASRLRGYSLKMSVSW
ncbi:MAG: hypothetical protein PUB99_00185 [Oscillospiraceae bacterium]|nr:hypothetical protein [Oscillospiraceae bacterium]